METSGEIRIDLERARDMARGCGWTLTELLEFYAPRARKEIAALAAAVESGDADDVARLAHGAAGSSASVGMASLCELYRDVERTVAGTNDAASPDRIDLLRRHVEASIASFEELTRDGA